MTFKISNDDWMKIYLPLLVSLAKRHNKNILDGIWADNLEEIGNFDYICRICNNRFHNRDIEDHGINHLKEYGLLYFI